MDREKVVKDNAIRGLQSAIEISGALVHLRKEHAKAILELLKEQEAVRCIDCEYHRHDDWCTELHRETKQNDYCSWGVKKDE